MNRLSSCLVIGLILFSFPVLAQKMASDADSDGKVSKQEYLQSASKLAEKSGKQFDPAFAEKVFEKRDQNGDGFITFDEQPAAKPAQ